MTKQTPLGAVARGLAAGVVGTAVMTGWQELSMKLQSSDPEGGGQDGGGQADQQPQDPWEQASVPAQVARKVLKGLFDRDVPADKIGLLTNVVHWSYGTGWGAVFGLVEGTRRGPALRDGLAFGTVVWLISYVQLVPMGLYQPTWKYSPGELAMELSYHLAYGAGVGAGYSALDR